MDDANRRGAERIPASFNVNFIHEGDYVISSSRDISVDGIFICTGDPPPAGTQLSLVFSVGELQELEIAGMVVWTNEAGPKREQGMGVQFLEPLPPDIKRNLMQLVNRITVLETNAHLA